MALVFFHTLTSTQTGAELIIADGAGWKDVLNLGYFANDSEVGLGIAYGARLGEYLSRWSGDPVTARGDPETTWDYVRARVPSAADGGWQSIYTYHSQTFTAAGTVYGSAGGTVTLNLHLSSTGELLLTTSRVGNGAFSFTWFDPHADVYVDAYEDDSHIGRSLAGKAGTDTFDVIMGRPPIVRAA
jgi:hypothetical protein